MGKNQLHSFWPVLVGEFFNPEHNLIKDELINFFTKYEKNFPEGNSQLKDKDYAGNYNLYQSKYDLHTEKNEALQSVLKFIAMSILEMSKTGLKRKNSAGSENITYASASLQMVDGSGNIIRPGEIISLQTSTTTQLSTNVDWRDGDIVYATKQNPEPTPYSISDPTITFKVISTGARNRKEVFYRKK